jgi:alcohol dehydrogenase (cytochrome c)
MNSKTRRFWLGTCVGLLLSSASAVTGPTQEQLNNADTATDSWLMYNKGYKAQRYSSLDQINADNVAQMKRSCTFETGDDGGFQVTPQMYNGVLFFTQANRTFAVDARTCKALWVHKYMMDTSSVMMTNRGVAIADGVIYRGTPNAHLIALDAGTGKQLWDTKVADSTLGYFLSAAPIYYNGKILIGEAGADWGVKAHMYAFDAKTGKKAWTFDLIPTGSQKGAETWKRAASTATGGGSTWSSYTLDADTGEVYISVGNPAPDFAAQYRPGDNLFTNTVTVLNAETGEYSHHYQQIPNDDKDYDTSAAPVLYEVDGVKRMAVATKAGWLFSYDEAAKKQIFKQAMIKVTNQEKPTTREGLDICPNYSAGSQWSGPSYDPVNKTLYVNSVDWCGNVKLGEVRLIKGQLFFGGAMQLDPANKAIGKTSAFDAATGKPKWSYDLPSIRIVGGVTSTAGNLVLAGSMDGTFYALDSRTGKVLFKDNVDKAPVGGGVSTYEIGGKQYMAIAAGNTSKGTAGVKNLGSRIAIYTLP